MLLRAIPLLTLLPVTFLVAATDLNNCKCFPGDECWPTEDDWQSFNKSVGGRLIATVPLGSPCHDPTYDIGECQALQEQWLYSRIQ